MGKGTAKKIKRVVSRIYTPIGSIYLESDEDGKKVFKVDFEHQKSKKLRCENPDLEVVKQLCEYFKGVRREFDVEFELRGTDFQVRVWRELLNIPYGSTVTYKELAEKIGKPRAFRAVGNALAKNPLPILVPCHRVVSKNDLGGFGGGLEWKRSLLRIEKGELEI